MRGHRNCSRCSAWRPVTDFRPTQWLWGFVSRISSDCNHCYLNGNAGDYIIVPQKLQEDYTREEAKQKPPLKYVFATADGKRKKTPRRKGEDLSKRGTRPSEQREYKTKYKREWRKNMSDEKRAEYLRKEAARKEKERKKVTT